MSVVNMRNEPFDVYIGRGKGGTVPLQGRGMFGNPVAVGRRCEECGGIHWTGPDTLPCYRNYLERRIQDPAFRAEVMKLRGKVLGCFCKPNPCHGDILEEFVNGLDM